MNISDHYGTGRRTGLSVRVQNMGSGSGDAVFGDKAIQIVLGDLEGVKDKHESECR